MASQKIYELDVARDKIQKYCAYQERAHSEVVTKLKSFGLTEVAVDALVLELLQLNFLNEERFARAYASGKFRMKKWGKQKIKQGLKQKQVSEKCIELGLSEIDENEYLTALKSVLERKWETTKESNPFAKKKKVANYLFNRGFESDMIWEELEAY